MSFTLISSTKLDHNDDLDRDVSKWNVVVSDGENEFEIEVFVNDDDNSVEFEQPEGLEDFEQDELFVLLADTAAKAA
ncbi:hypothetical protein [Frateuria sp. Soil773]|uniref:hypothetical protein n=1 Tax=Frateuria sp. Soil773 TaxID=1736407 RepID=UPI0012FB503B|nr:hypothetical protein [Frateuria sp. Soil773]